MIRALALAAAILLAGAQPASAADGGVTLAALGGPCPDRPSWSLTLAGGWPTSALRTQVGLARCVAVVAEVDATVLRRFRPQAGLSFTVVGDERFRLSWEILGGAGIQVGAVPEKGPTAAVRVRLAGSLKGIVVPYLSVGLRGSFFLDRTRYLSPDSAAADTVVRARTRWSVRYGLGLGLAIHRNIGLFAGLDLGMEDIVRGGVTLPGFRGGLIIGGLP